MSISQITQQLPIWSRAVTALASTPNASSAPPPSVDKDGDGAKAATNAITATTATSGSSPFQQLSQGMQAVLLQLQSPLGGTQAAGSQLASTGSSAVDAAPGGTGAIAAGKPHGHHHHHQQDNGAGSGVSIAGTGIPASGDASSMAA